MKITGRKQLGAVALFLIVVALLWRQVFVMTGILWWQAPRSADRPAPPPAAHFKQASTQGIDLNAYYRNHKEWPLD